MPTFSSFGAFADYLQNVARRVPTVNREILETVGSRVQEAAEVKLGAYQPAAGPFAAWAALSPNTVADARRQRLTGGAESPLYVTGKHIHETVFYRVIAPAVDIGSDDPVAGYQERGYSVGKRNLPSRSFLGSAMFEQAPALQQYAKNRLITLIMTGR